LEVVRAVKVHNLPIRQAALEFNMNYRALYRYCKNPWRCVPIWRLNFKYGVNYHIFTVLFKIK